MGSRAKRARNGLPAKIKISQNDKVSYDFWPIPDLTSVDMAFGNIKHLPPCNDIPDRFRWGFDPYTRFVRDWFFSGRTEDDMRRLTARSGVDRERALVAIKAILMSFAPKHEHKEAGCAFLLYEWFELSDKPIS